MTEKEVFGISNEGKPPLLDRVSEKLYNAVYEAIYHASQCWTDTGGEVTFNGRRAGMIAFDLCHEIADEIDAERAAKEKRSIVMGEVQYGRR